MSPPINVDPSRPLIDNAGISGRRWESVALLAILLLTLTLRLWGLEKNGWGAEYYTAAVRSMAANWHNFFYAAFDPEGFISVDKPPIALWVQVASVKLFGFHPLSVLLPQVLEGVASVWILFHLVRRRFGGSAALLAALFLSVMPVCVAVNRTNNTDSCLLVALLLAAWALMRAAEDGNRRLLLLSMALIGLGFNIKMLAAFIVVPAMFFVYFVGAQKPWPRRFVDLTLAVVVLAATSLPWVLAYQLTPAEYRPFVGGSRNNSMLELVVGHNGIGRFVSRIKPTAVTSPAAVATEARPRSVVSRLFVRAPAGPFRLADAHLVAQVGWLFPLAVMALLIGASQSKLRRPLAPAHLALLFWSCWLVIYGVVYSYAGGIMHFYYLSTMAPALAALAGIGVVGLWGYYRQRGSLAFLLPAAVLLTAAWEIYIQVNALGWTFNTVREASGDWLLRVHVALAGGTVVAVAGLLLIPYNQFSDRVTHLFAAGALGVGILALLAVPVAWALSSVLVAGQGVLPSADLYRLDPGVRNGDARIHGRFGQSIDTSKLVAFLENNRMGERYLLATSTAQLAAPIIIKTGEEVMARGGFHGLDPAITPESLAQLVRAKQVRFAMLGDVAVISRRMGADAAGKPTADWIRANGKPIPSGLWRSYGGSTELYDLRPEAGLR
jgi:4-amino-4-deoxy-L-arabinose transferase-like glycosyltransferase